MAARNTSSARDIRDAITRLSDISYDVSRMLAVHEEKIDQLQDHSRRTALELEQRRSDLDRVVDTYRKEFSDYSDKVGKKIDDLGEKFDKKDKAMDQRVSRFERLWLMILGGWMVLMSILVVAMNVYKLFFQA